MLRFVDNWKHRDSDLKVQALHYANELLVRVSLPLKNFCKLAQHVEAIRKHSLEKEYRHCRWEYRPQNHILICFNPVWTSKKMFFSSEREFQKALRDTLMRAAWCELLSTMANCGKIVTFLCLGISIITWVIILKEANNC